MHECRWREKRKGYKLQEFKSLKALLGSISGIGSLEVLMLYEQQ